MAGRAKGRLICIFVTGAVVAIISRFVLTPRSVAPGSPHGPALKTAIYIWQRSWSEEVAEAVERAAGKTDGFMVLAAEMTAEHTAPAFQPDWKALSRVPAGITLVVRMHVSLSRWLSQGKAEEAVASIERTISEHLDTARRSGVRVAGIQLDYDCPTLKLADYAGLMKVLRHEFPKETFSITALPTWLGSHDFADLAKNLSYFVLQVHSLDKPTTIADPLVLCDISRIDSYLHQASAIGTPYYVSLPTYGYRVVFDENGKFAGLCAEGPLPAWRPGYQERFAMADPAEIVKVVRALHANPPPNCLGIAWFRLPVDTDELNWPWLALSAVMAGGEPGVSFKGDIRGNGDLFELWVSNNGEMNVVGKVRLKVDLHGKTVRAWDALGDFEEDSRADGDSLVLIGPAPAVGSPMRIAWFRLQGRDFASRDPIRVSHMEVLQ